MGLIDGLIANSIAFAAGRAKRKIDEKKEQKRQETIKQEQIERTKKEQEELELKRQKQAQIEQERKGLDWTCSKCSFLNPGKNLFCSKCGNRK